MQILTTFQYASKQQCSPRFMMSLHINTQEYQNELKTNVSILEWYLGGDNHSHLGLILADLEYATVTAVPYLQPTNPGVVIPVGITNWET